VGKFIFVDRVHTMASLPEAWTPYQAWMNVLTGDDTVISFN